MAREPNQADRRQHAREREQDWDSHRDQAPEHDQQDCDRDRNRSLTGQLELVCEHLVERLLRTDAGVADVKPWMARRDVLGRRR
jgi:hypothetical protein